MPVAGRRLDLPHRKRVQPDHSDAWPRISRDFTEATRAEEGYLWLGWSWRSVEDPDEYVLVEAFRDGDAGGLHVGSDHFKTAQQTLPRYLAETPRIVDADVPGTRGRSSARCACPADRCSARQRASRTTASASPAGSACTSTIRRLTVAAP